KDQLQRIRTGLDAEATPEATADAPAAAVISDFDRAKAFLCQQLAAGPKRSLELHAVADRDEIPRKTLMRAKAALKVEHGNVGFRGPVSWWLPEQNRPAAERAPRPKLDLAMNWLRSQPGDDLTTEKRKQGRQNGFAPTTLLRAWRGLRQVLPASAGRNGTD